MAAVPIHFKGISHPPHCSWLLLLMMTWLCTQVNIWLTAEQADLLCEKYSHDDYPELVNYVAFSHTVDPPLDRLDAYV
jgi:hypothetical protein